MMIRVMMKLLLLLMAFFFVIKSTSSAEPQVIESISLIQLIANPEAYNGKTVRVSGYFHRKFEDSALYLSKEAADYLEARNAIWVNFAKNIDVKTDIIPHDSRRRIADLDCQYVGLVGTFTFDKRGNGHMGGFSGELNEVARGSVDRRYYDGKNELP